MTTTKMYKYNKKKLAVLRHKSIYQIYKTHYTHYTLKISNANGPNYRS